MWLPLAVLVIAVSTACNGYRIAPIAPITKASVAHASLPKHPRLLILSPVSLPQVSAALTLESNAQHATSGSTATGVLQTVDYNEAQGYLEAAFINLGWRPLSSGLLMRATTRPEVSQALTANAHMTITQLALLLSPYVEADAIFVLRAVTLRQTEPAVSCDNKSYGIFAYEVMLDGALIAVQTGEVLWSGNTIARSESTLTSAIEGTTGSIWGQSCAALSNFEPAPVDAFCVGMKDYCGDHDHGPRKIGSIIETGATSLAFEMSGRINFQ